jgi:hypothetical protein
MAMTDKREIEGPAEPVVQPVYGQSPLAKVFGIWRLYSDLIDKLIGRAATAGDKDDRNGSEGG